jgi:hypothetical protein
MEVLEHIERERVLPLLVVVQTLMKKRDLTVGVIKPFVARQLQRELSQVAGDRDKIRGLQQETSTIKAEVYKLQTEVTPGTLAQGPDIAGGIPQHF